MNNTARKLETSSENCDFRVGREGEKHINKIDSHINEPKENRITKKTRVKQRGMGGEAVVGVFYVNVSGFSKRKQKKN